MKAVITFLALITIAFGTLAAEKPDKQLAMEYLEASQLEQAINASIDAYSRELLTRVPPESRARFEGVMQETMGWDATKSQIADLVVSMYTKDELKAYIAFSKTKLGRSFNEKTATFSDKMSALLATNIQRLLERNIVPSASSDTSPRSAQ